ncbi:MAG: SDR family NAD(P)-dependent oxidoreductase, partial [Novosphingobium sp.]|nr:SDR family NAD(P)-dependent oxidoreductase [Novosphingobium sp.]
MKNGQLSGRSVLITGASSGLGERFARICAREGAAVTVGARRVDRIEALASRIVEDGGRAIAVPLDVTDEKTIVAAYDAADQAFGRVDSVVANAGIEI